MQTGSCDCKKYMRKRERSEGVRGKEEGMGKRGGNGRLAEKKWRCIERKGGREQVEGPLSCGCIGFLQSYDRASSHMDRYGVQRSRESHVTR